MSNQSWPGVSSLVLNEPLLWEKGRPGRVGVSLPVIGRARRPL